MWLAFPDSQRLNLFSSLQFIEKKKPTKQKKPQPLPLMQVCMSLSVHLELFYFFKKIRIINEIVVLTSLSIKFSSNLKTDYFLKFFNF